MTDREKVVSAIQNCIAVQKCRDCPWEECEEQHVAVDGIPLGLMRDTLKLLEKQEPRVMTLEEVVKHYSLPPVVLDDIGWQQEYLQDIEPLYFDFSIDYSWAVHWRGYQQALEYIDGWKASYGQKWRCWTSRPTEEQRKAVKWE